jgi:hypothetical protein
MASNPIHIKASNEGLLHENMGVPKGKKISVADMMSEKAKAKREGDSAEVKRARFALNARKWARK